MSFVSLMNNCRLVHKIVDRIMAIPTVKLNNGFEMPIFGLGTMFVSGTNEIIRVVYYYKIAIVRLEKMLVYKLLKMLLI